MEERNPVQIARFDSKGCLMEIIDAFEIGKVRINIAPYNTATNKQTALNAFYLDFCEWFSLSQRIQLGALLSEAYGERMRSEQAKQAGQQYYMRDLFIQYGGTSAAKLRTKRQSGCDEARVFRVYPALRDNSVMFSIARGDGKQEAKGSIKPQFNPYLNDSDGRTVVTKMPVDYHALRGACQMVDMRIQAFIIQQQLNGAFLRPSQNENESREGISNNPLPVQQMNQNEHVIPDEVAFPPEGSGASASSGCFAGSGNYPPGNDYFAAQQPWDVYSSYREVG